MKIAGKISPIVSWLMMFDVSKALSLNASTSTVSGKQVVTDASVNQSSRLLQDAMLTLDPARNLHIDAGQFRLPLGGIGSTGSSGLETVERPMFQSDRARGGSLGDVRDIGVMVRGSARTFADYWVGAFNGSGESMNTVDANNQKSLVGRFTMRTPVNGLRVGASGLRSGFHAGNPTRKDRLGAEAVYSRAAWIVRAEVQDGKDGSVNRLGSFVQLGYRATSRVQLVTRFDSWDPDTKKDADLASARTKDAMGGATWLLAGDNARLQFNVSHRWFAHSIAKPINQLLVNLQASW